MSSELGRRMLLIVAKRGYTGAEREIFFHYIRGIRYTDLEREILTLEREGFITIEWVGPSNFTVFITPKGVEYMESFQHDTWQKSVEALKELGRAKHREKSIIHEEVGYAKMLEEKMNFEELDQLSGEIPQEIDENIIEERDNYPENPAPEAIGIPVDEEYIENESIIGEELMVESRTSGEIDYEDTGEGELIESSIEYPSEELEEEEKIGVNEATNLKKRTQETRASGVIEGAETEAMPAYAIVDENTTGFDNFDDTELVAVSQEDIMEDDSSTDFYQQIEAVLSINNSHIPETGASHNPGENSCFWETERVCPLLKSGQFSSDDKITLEHCMVCQLIEIKRLLKK